MMKNSLNNKKSENYRLQSIQWLDKKSLQLSVLDDVTTGIINMGKALDTRHAPAMVAILKDQDSSQFRLYLNSQDFKDFSPEERAGVVWHELNHILNNHLVETSKREELGMSNKQLLTIAQEIICNDTVLYHGLKLPHMFPDDMSQGIFYGEKILGFNCFGKTTKEVYDLLEESDYEPPQQSNNNSNNSGGNNTEDSDDSNNGQQESNSSQDGSHNTNDNSDSPDGSQQGDDGNSCGGVYVDPDISDEELENIVDNLIKDIIDGMIDPIDIVSDKNSDISSKTNSASMSPGSSTREELIKKGDVKLEYFKLLERIDPKIVQGMSGGLGHKKMREDWRFKPRSLMGLTNKQTPLLPKMVPYKDKSRGDDLPLIVFAVDQSGSIGAEDARKTRELATTIPNNLADIHTVAFAEDCAEMSKNGDILGNIGCGTNFSSVGDYVTKHMVNHNKKPRDISIVMITDGYDFGSQLSQYNFRWFWCDLNDNSREEFYTILQSRVRLSNDINMKDIFNVRDISKWQ